MLFSIIIPVYNVENYMRQCVDSVLAQDFNDYELILVDDGSSDGSVGICDEYAQKDNRVTVIHKENGGSSDARNTGLLKAKGDYIIFIDSDDYWDDTHALSLIAEKANTEHSDIIAYGCKILRGDTVKESNHRYFSDYKGLDPSQTLYKLVLDGKLHISGCTMSVRRAFLLENGLLFKKGMKCEDIEWGIRIFVHEPTWSFLTENFYIYRKGREGSNTATVDYKHLQDYCRILEDSLALVGSCKPKTKEALISYIMYQTLICISLIGYTKLSGKQRRELHNRLKPICKEYLLKYDLNSKVKLGGKVYRISGYFGMSRLLGFYLVHRSR